MLPAQRPEGQMPLRIVLSILLVALAGCEALLPRSDSPSTLLGSGRAGADQAYTVRVATDDASLAELWRAMGLAGGPPTVAWSDRLVAGFAQGIGSGCQELELERVVFDEQARVVYPVFVDPFAPRACDADLAGAVTFVVSLDRRALPELPVRVRLVAADQPLPCGGDCGSGVPGEVEVR